VKRLRLFQALAIGATSFLAGCFVTADNPPLQQGPLNDPAIVGDWRSVDESTGKLVNSFLHIQQPEENGPLRVVFVEGKEHNVYTVTTSIAGRHKVFSATSESGDLGTGALLGYYAVEGDELLFHLLASESVSNLIRRGKVAGVPGAKTYDSARLTGSSADIARFLASEEGWNARVQDASRLRRLRPEQ
jgi:hypothetical protein